MKLSIVTIHLNDFQGLKRTLASVRWLSSSSSVEWVVIDGKSPLDDPKSVVLDEVRRLAKIFISEPDEGIYDAMNKGTRLATGNYVLFLNAGDELHPEFDLKLFIELADSSSAEMIWGQCQEHYANGTLMTVKTRSTAWAWYGMPAYHPAIFFRREALTETPYDTEYRIAADYNLVCRLLTGGAQVEQFKFPVSIFHRGGMSDVHGKMTREEENRIRLKYFRVPAALGNALKIFKGVNAQLAKVTWFRRLWRRWI